MGLRDYRKWKREQELKESETIKALEKRIAELEKLVASRPAPVDPFTEDEKKKLKMAQDAATKPQDFINLFTGDLEEFNPNA